MFINNQQALQTLDILVARHQKIIDEIQNKNVSVGHSPDEVTTLTHSFNALKVYQPLKQKYQPSAK
jgi:hypothetical protein